MFIGTAGWALPKFVNGEFPVMGSHLESYAQILNATEINSSFYREHEAKTYARWAQVTPAHFQFSVKLSKRFTHEQKLRIDEHDLQLSLENILHLDQKLGVILVQLAGSLEFEPKPVERFYKILRKMYLGPLVLEPRNLSWMESDSLELMRDFSVSKVNADPEKCPGGDVDISSAGGLTYHRLHGTPDIYRSSYGANFLKDLSRKITDETTWCIFDNTTLGHATQNALDFLKIRSR